MNIISLCKLELDHVKMEAELQLRQCERFGGRTSFGRQGQQRSAQQKLEDACRGLALEMAVSKYLNIPPEFHQYQHRTGQPDMVVLCEGQQVRAQIKEGGPSVIIRPHDRDDEIAISGVVNLKTGTVTIFGYRNIGEIRQLAKTHLEWIMAPRGGAVAIFMPQKSEYLKSISDLTAIESNQHV